MDDISFVIGWMTCYNQMQVKRIGTNCLSLLEVLLPC